jgi:DNA-binding transcriptional MocR family regulator
MALWLTGAGPWRDPARFEPWVRACTAKGFKLRPGRWFMLDGTPIAATRFGFTACRPEELQQAVALCAGEPR